MPEIAFRKEALERLSSPDQLDERVAPVPSRGWLALAGLGIFFAFVFAFAVFSEIPVKATAIGILLMKGPGFELSAPSSSELVEWHVDVGDSVTKGQLLGTLKDPELEEQLRLESADLMALKQSKRANRELEIAEAQYRVDYLKEKLETVTQLIADKDGMVIQIEAYPPARVNAGQTLILFSPLGDLKKDLVAYAFVDSRDASAVAPGQKVEITMKGERIEATGLLIGKVRSSSPFFLSQGAISNIVRIPGLAKEITDKVGLTPHLVIVDLEAEPQSTTGYHWTGFDPVKPITPGLSFTASIIVDQSHPIDYAVPVFERIL